MKKPVLVIMAAGMGSRYGGMKQIDPCATAFPSVLSFKPYPSKIINTVGFLLMFLSSYA